MQAWNTEKGFGFASVGSLACCGLVDKVVHIERGLQSYDSHYSHSKQWTWPRFP